MKYSLSSSHFTTYEMLAYIVRTITIRTYESLANLERTTVRTNEILANLVRNNAMRTYFKDSLI